MCEGAAPRCCTSTAATSATTVGSSWPISSEAATLVVGSRYDGDIGYVNSTHAAQGIPDAELMAVDQFGHLIWWGDPSVRANLHLRIEAFLSEHAGRLTRSGQQPSG